MITSEALQAGLIELLNRRSIGIEIEAQFSRAVLAPQRNR